MDRIYTNFDSDVIKFKEFAKEKGWMYRYTNNSRIEDSVVFGFDGNKPIYGEIEVKLDGKFDRYPYLDTLKYLSIDKDKLYNVPKVGSHILMDHERHRSQKCYNCDGDVMTSDGLCFDCAKGYRVLNDMDIKFKIKD